jgi:hypothetical protein
MLNKGATTLAAVALLTLSAQAIPWFFAPTNQHGSLGNNYDEFQNYGSSPYFHDGIDAMSGAGGVDVFSVSDGWMTHESPGTMYGGLMIGDQYIAGGTGWLYWHMPNSTYPFNVGDHINVGDFIGDVATWSVASFHHVHFNHVVGTGGLPWSWYASIDNPLDFMEPNSEPQTPTIYNAVGANLLAFCVNNTSTYVNANSLTGDVDIISKIGDKIWNNTWEVVPYRISYTIAGGSITDTRQAFVFNGALPAAATVTGVVYKDDGTCNSEGNYDFRNFFFILTNNDDDSLIETTDNAGKWHTAGYPAGPYTVTVQAWDRGGNVAQNSMNVTVLAAPTYNVTIDLSPTSSLTLPAGGGSFTYTVNIQNLQGSTVNFDGWIDMTYPSGAVSTVILRNITLPAGGSVFRNMSQTIAGSEPNGTYSYTGNVGYHPYNPWASDGFTFTKGLDGFDVGSWVEKSALTGWDDELTPQVLASSEMLPENADLVSVYPNPFNPETAISFQLSTNSKVSLGVYDTAGRMVAELAKGWMEAGSYRAVFDGSALPSGIYVYRLAAGNQISSGKLVLMK